jgi:hypothetical protein
MRELKEICHREDVIGDVEKDNESLERVAKRGYAIVRGSRSTTKVGCLYLQPRFFSGDDWKACRYG